LFKAGRISICPKVLKGSSHHIRPWTPKVRELEDENERLKRLVARQALELEFKSELLKHAVINPSKKKRS